MGSLITNVGYGVSYKRMSAGNNKAARGKTLGCASDDDTGEAVQKPQAQSLIPAFKLEVAASLPF